MGLRQLERARRGSGGMGERAASVVLLALVMVSQSFLVIGQSELDDASKSLETDYGGPMTYTAEHTYATLGPAGIPGHRAEASCAT